MSDEEHFPSPVMVVSEEAFQRILDTLRDPAEPTPALIEAFRKYAPKPPGGELSQEAAESLLKGLQDVQAGRVAPLVLDGSDESAPR
jgi:hypothetical protein